MSTEEKNLTEENISEQRKIRRDKLKALQDAGRNPFLTETWDVNAYSQDIKDDFENMDGKEVSIAGRMMAKRGMGKASFIDIQDKKEGSSVMLRRMFWATRNTDGSRLMT